LSASLAPLSASPAAVSASPAALASEGAQTPPAPKAAPQEKGFPGSPVNHRPVVEIAWNRFYDVPEIYALLDKLEAAYPKLVQHETIGQSTEKRELRVYTITNPDTGKDTEKPGMWIDGNVHGNEVQGAEGAVYAAWYLLENYGSNPEITALVDSSTFYVL